ncbi:MAG: glycosyltransferase [Planctomycetaceae bacterium]
MRSRSWRRASGCRDRIVFAGHREDASALMAAFDAFVLGSDFEGMSNSLMEAMSLGLPCIASDIPPNRELIIDGETGLLYPVGKSPGLAKLSAMVLSDVALADRLGRAARQCIANHHKVEQLVKAHESMYQRLLNSSAS